MVALLWDFMGASFTCYIQSSTKGRLQSSVPLALRAEELRTAPGDRLGGNGRRFVLLSDMPLQLILTFLLTTLYFLLH